MSERPSAIDLDHLRQWIGREMSIHDPLAPFPARALASALDRPQAPSIGDSLPLARHWLYFLDLPKGSETGMDGHPKLGGFLPPVPLARRMWAAGRIDVHAPLLLGQPATRTTTIRAVDLKAGKTGELVFVTLDHELSQERRLCIREEQSLVYRETPAQGAPLPAGAAAPPHADFSIVFDPDPVLLFRYSALTYNGHRIHYDRTYATEQEFHPALVVHGPLLVTLLLDLLHDNIRNAQVKSFRFRALRPSFDTTPLTLAGSRDGNDVTLWSADSDGYLCMSASARLA